MATTSSGSPAQAAFVRHLAHVAFAGETTPGDVPVVTPVDVTGVVEDDHAPMPLAVQVPFQPPARAAGDRPWA
jgi:hypothetical protein